MADPMMELLRKCVCEFVGTFMLVFTVGCNVLGKGAVDGTSNQLYGVTSIACTLMVMIYCFGPVSGGHLNPCVSIACGLARKCPWLDVGAYVVTQVGAGIAAGFCYCTLFGARVALKPVEGAVWWEAMVVEVLYTAMIAFVVLSVACSKRNTADQNQFYALAIGFVVIAGGYGAGSISGGAFNPAVSLGIDISSYNDGVWQGWVYSAYQLIGAGLAAVLFRLTRPEDFEADVDEDYSPTLPTRLASEFLGTFMLVLTVGLNVLGGSTCTAWSAGAALMCMIYALGDVSGGHFNPAVTLAVYLSKKADNCSTVRDAVAYIMIQLMAGILASILYAGLEKSSTFPLGPKAPYNNGAAYLLEFIFTFVIAFVVLSTACVKGISSKLNRNFYFALAIGMSLTAGGFASGPVSGGSLNPAVSFGISVSHTLNHGQMWYCVTYSLVELAGGVLAALIFFITHTKEYNVPKSVEAPAEAVSIST